MPVDVTVVAPCYNEAKNLPELVSRLLATFRKKGIAGEVILVNDGSRDDTGAIVDALASEHAEVRAFHHPVNRGIEAGWNTGVAAARGFYVCLIDADLQNLPEDVWRLYREIRGSGADLVQGYRSSIGRLQDSRFIVSRTFNWMLNTLFGMRQRDNKSGFVIARKAVLEATLRHRYRYEYFQSFITVSAFAKGYTVREIETLFESRLLGESFMPRIPIRVILGCLVDLAKAVLEFRLAFKKEEILEAFLKERPPARADAPLTGWRRLLMAVFFNTMPLHKWLITRQARLYYAELKRSQWLSPGEIRELQERKLRRLVDQAYHHVPYYRQKLDEAGLKPEDVRSLDDLARLPLLDKNDVRGNLYFDLFSDNHDKREILKVATSGSTGEPFVLYADRHQLEIRWAATLRSLEWTGYRFGDRQARLWHQTIGMTWLQSTRERIDALLNRRLFIPAFEMSDESIARFVLRLRRYRPVLVDGYAESFNFLAHYLKSHDVPGLRPKALVSSAQVLPDQSRKIIEETFGCRVFDKYGSREFSGIAYECGAHDGHHVVAESYIVEILKEGQPAAPGEMGEVVITDLNNYCVPLIRYRLGDLAVAMDGGVPCPCGRGLPRVGRIEGRVQAIIVGTRGNYVPGTFFAHLFKDYDYVIRQYQVVQEEAGRISLKVVKASRFDEGVFAEVVELLKRYLGAEMKIDVEFVEKIGMVRTGKQQGSISKIEIDIQKPAGGARAS